MLVLESSGNNVQNFILLFIKKNYSVGTLTVVPLIFGKCYNASQKHEFIKGCRTFSKKLMLSHFGAPTTTNLRYGGVGSDLG